VACTSHPPVKAAVQVALPVNTSHSRVNLFVYFAAQEVFKGYLARIAPQAACSAQVACTSHPPVEATVSVALPVNISH
jgi:hypothetical protein